MDEIIKFLSIPGGQGEQLGALEFTFAILLSIVCVGFICVVYRFTHKSVSYSQSYVHTLMLVGMVTTLIMIVIGSNIARAFSLVGALSIIRFRNAVKETRDVGYIFFAIAVAMACGTRFYALAMLATVTISSIMIIMYMFDFGSGRKNIDRLLTVRMPPHDDPESVLKPIFEDLFESYRLISMETVRQGLFTELHFSVRPKSKVYGNQVVAAINKINDNQKVIYNYSSHLDDM